MLRPRPKEPWDPTSLLPADGIGDFGVETVGCWPCNRGALTVCVSLEVADNGWKRTSNVHPGSDCPCATPAAADAPMLRLVTSGGSVVVFVQEPINSARQFQGRRHFQLTILNQHNHLLRGIG